MRATYNASWISVFFGVEEAPRYSRLIGEMERAMTFKLGERGVIDEDIPIGCPQHPNFEITCPRCVVIFRERNRVRPFSLSFPKEGQNYYILRIPTGLMGYLLEKGFSLPDDMRAALNQVSEIIRKRTSKLLLPSGKFEPLSERAEHLRTARTALQSPRFIVKGIPGAGKTWVALTIIKNISPTARICWLTHTRSLLNQTANRMREHFKEPIGIVGEGTINLRERITVAMFQTVYSRLQEKDPAMINFTKNVDVLIIDEFHHVAATTFFVVTQAFEKAYIRYGLSATPFREIRKENYLLIGGLTHKVVTIDVKPTPIHLILYDMLGSVHVPEFKGHPSKYQRQYEIAIVRNVYRNMLTAYEAVKHRPSVVLVQRIEHGERLAAMIKEISKRMGTPVRVDFLWGEHTAEERANILSSFEKGKIDVLILSDVGKEGLSLKRLNCVVLAAGQKSKVALIQRVGRGLHPKGKEYVRVVDFLDAGGLPRNHSFKRLKTMEGYFKIMKKEKFKWNEALKRADLLLLTYLMS